MIIQVPFWVIAVVVLLVLGFIARSRQDAGASASTVSRNPKPKIGSKWEQDAPMAECFVDMSELED